LEAGLWWQHDQFAGDFYYVSPLTQLLRHYSSAVAIQRLRNDFWQSKPSPDINMTAGILLKKPFELSMGRVTKTNPQHLGYQQGYFEAPTESIDKIVWSAWHQKDC
jgi:hypothetical protein